MTMDRAKALLIGAAATLALLYVIKNVNPFGVNDHLKF